MVEIAAINAALKRLMSLRLRRNASHGPMAVCVLTAKYKRPVSAVLSEAHLACSSRFVSRYHR